MLRGQVVTGRPLPPPPFSLRPSFALYPPTDRLGLLSGINSKRIMNQVHEECISTKMRDECVNYTAQHGLPDRQT